MFCDHLQGRSRTYLSSEAIKPLNICIGIKNADEALQQIEDKGYAQPYAADPRRLYKIGVNFLSERRCIGEWKMSLV
ncbi:MAG: PD-(D/E)XK nuclease domain-containing protein [Bacteroidaceae bacterium]|nr:PD-(D/E)XK nuclease domain-containing protein [Bacteroidaceae bacterium]